MLERCDKIWETLQLIKVQYETVESKDEEKKEEEKNDSQEEAAPPDITLPVKTQRRKTYDGKTPFHFSVQKTRKLFPCVTCDKQYMEKRSLRKHALREHGVIIPVRRRLSRKSKKIDIQDSNTSSSEGNDNLYKKATTGKSETTRFSSVSTYSKRLQNVSNVDSSNNQSKNRDTTSPVHPKAQYNKCALCRQEVKCVKKHLINYHKVGCSADMLKQLETSLVIENRSSSGSSKPTLKDILSGKPPEASINRDILDKSPTSSKSSTHKMSQVVAQKQKYKLSYTSPEKRFKVNNGHVLIQKKSKIAQSRVSDQNKCDICLGVYANPKTLEKHKRIHVSRGETKENFHNFVCKYFNSPLSERYQRAKSSVQSTDDNNVKNSDNSLNGSLRSGNTRMSLRQDQKTDRAAKRLNIEDTTCLCGRTFRNRYVLCLHRNNCKVCKQEDKLARYSARDEYSSDRDSGIGINITIKKRNNSYEIVGKDDEEDKQGDHVADGTLSFNVSTNVIKDATNADAGQKRSDEGNISKCNKNHSALKLRDVDEDLTIDIGEHAYLLSKRKRNQKGFVEGNEDKSCSRQDEKEDNVRTLKQMCQEAIKKLSLTLQKSGIEYTPTETKANLQSVNTSHETMEKGHMKSKVRMMDFDPMICAYCNEHFSTMILYNKHQCTVDEGRRFDEYSLNLLCFSCNATLDSCSQFDQHMRTKHDRLFYCYLCPKKFWNKKSRNKHTNTDHDTSCRFCNVNMPMWMINLHESYHLGFGYPCHRCKKAYSSRKNLSYHNSTIHSLKNATTFCNLCLRSVKLKNFRSHMHSHDDKKCHFCGKEFNDKLAVEYHTMVFHGETISKLKCNDCGILYMTKRQFELHKNTAGLCKEYKRGK